MLVVKYRDILREENTRIFREVVEENGVLIYPTDTLYGLGGNFLSPVVMEKVDRIKKRKDMPYSAMVPGMEKIEELVREVPPVFRQLYRELLPGKFTFLFPVSTSVDPILVRGGDTIGIRIPAVDAMLKLLEMVNVPLITTSVNRSGTPPLNRSRDIISEFGSDVDLFIDAGDLPFSSGSTILDITATPIKCLRKGDDYQQFEALGLDWV